MELWEFSLKLNGPFMTPWQADILFGHMAWAYREGYGEKALKEWLNEFKNGQPPFVISDGWFKDYFPRPLIPDRKQKITDDLSKEEKLNIHEKVKSFNKTKALHKEDFVAFLQGNEMKLKDHISAGKLFESQVIKRNLINRDTNRTLTKDGLYEMEEFHPGESDILSVFVRVKNQEALKQVKQLFEVISYTGYGKKKSVGYGQFEVQNETKRPGLDIQEESNGVIWLNHGVPAQNDPVDGWYKLTTKFGKVSGGYGLEGNVFKKPLSRIIPGSVFQVDEPRGYYGRMIEGIYPENPLVVQYGYALALPVKLPS